MAEVNVRACVDACRRNRVISGWLLVIGVSAATMSCRTKDVRSVERQIKSMVAVGGGQACKLTNGRITCSFAIDIEGESENIVFGGTHFCAKQGAYFLCFSKKGSIERVTPPRGTDKVFFSSERVCAVAQNSLYCRMNGVWSKQLDGVVGFSQNLLVSCASLKNYMCCSETNSSDAPMPCERSPQTFVNMDTKKLDTCGITESGEAYCMGVLYNSVDAQGFHLSKQTPRTLVVGTLYGCEAISEGVYCWDGDESGIRRTRIIEGTVEDMSCDESICCAVKGAGLYCWSQEDNKPVTMNLL